MTSSLKPSCYCPVTDTPHKPCRRISFVDQQINECRCGVIFCNAHKAPEEHQCPFDFKKHGREQLRIDLEPGDEAVKKAIKRFHLMTSPSSSGVA